MKYNLICLKWFIRKHVLQDWSWASFPGIPLLFFPYNSTCRNFQRDSRRWTMSAILTRPSSLVWKLRIGIVQSSHWIKREKSLIVHVLILEWPSQWREVSQTGRTWDLHRTQGSRWDASRRKHFCFCFCEIKQNDNQWNVMPPLQIHFF